MGSWHYWCYAHQHPNIAISRAFAMQQWEQNIAQDRLSIKMAADYGHF